MDTTSKMSVLIGRRIDAIRIAPNDQSIAFDTDEGPFVFRLDADCCSETWVSDICGLHILGSVVAAVRDIPLPSFDDKRSRQEYDRFYGVLLSVEGGDDCTIIYRNSSNGYYGGDLGPVTREAPADYGAWQKIHHSGYGGVDGPGVDGDEWRAKGSG